MNRYLQYKNRKNLGPFIRVSGLVILAFIFFGCAHIISKETLGNIDRSIGYKELSTDPERYVGKTVLLGGVIVETGNRTDGTLLEIYQTELDSYGKPINTDVSMGRFLAMDKRFLDSEIYIAGRKVTVAGIVNGVEIKKLGETDYRYPYIFITEIHLWQEEPPVIFGPHNRDLWDPFWGYPWHRWYYPYSYWPYYSDMHYYKDTIKKEKVK